MLERERRGDSMKLEELIGKEVIMEAFYYRPFHIEGKIIRIEQDHIVLQESSQRGLTYLNRNAHIIILIVRENDAK